MSHGVLDGVLEQKRDIGIDAGKLNEAWAFLSNNEQTLVHEPLQMRQRLRGAARTLGALFAIVLRKSKTVLKKKSSFFFLFKSPGRVEPHRKCTEGN